MLAGSYQCTAEKGWFVTYLVLLPLVPVSCMTSLMKAAVHKITAVTVVVCQVFFSLLNVIFQALC